MSPPIGIGIGLGFGGGRAPFLPTSLPNLAIWLRADLGITLNGSTVSAWADQSINARNFTQATGASQPTYVAGGSAALNNLPLVRFGGSHGLIGIAANFFTGNNITVAAAFTMSSSAALQHIAGRRSGANSYALEAQNHLGQFYAVTGSYAKTNAAADDGTAQLLIGTYNGSLSPSTTMYKGGTAQTTKGTSTGNVPDTSDRNSIGAEANSVGTLGSFFTGDLAEVIMWDRILTASEIAQLATYMARY